MEGGYGEVASVRPAVACPLSLPSASRRGYKAAFSTGKAGMPKGLTSALRWIAFIPSAVVGAVLARVLIVVFNRSTFGNSDDNFLFGADTFLGKVFVTWMGGILFAIAGIYIAFWVAPSRKRIAGTVMAGLWVLLVGAGLFASILVSNGWGIWDGVAMLAGCVMGVATIWTDHTFVQQDMPPDPVPDIFGSDYDEAEPAAYAEAPPEPETPDTSQPSTDDAWQQPATADTGAQWPDPEQETQRFAQLVTRAIPDLKQWEMDVAAECLARGEKAENVIAKLKDVRSRAIRR